MLSGCVYNIHQHTGAMNLFRLAWNGWFGTSVCLCALASVCTFLFFSSRRRRRRRCRCRFRSVSFIVVNSHNENIHRHTTHNYFAHSSVCVCDGHTKSTHFLYIIFFVFSLFGCRLVFYTFLWFMEKKCSSIDVYISNYMYIFPLKRASWYAHIPINECELRRWEERSQHSHTHPNSYIQRYKQRTEWGRKTVQFGIIVTTRQQQHQLATTTIIINCADRREEKKWVRTKVRTSPLLLGCVFRKRIIFSSQRVFFFFLHNTNARPTVCLSVSLCCACEREQCVFACICVWAIFWLCICDAVLNTEHWFYAIQTCAYVFDVFLRKCGYRCKGWILLSLLLYVWLLWSLRFVLCFILYFFFSNVFLWPFVRYSLVASFLLLVLGKVTYTQRYSSGNSLVFSKAAHTFSSAFYLEANACMFFSVLLAFFLLL